jgi:uncharacterized PurR-regulated membrane protein YhhQ (DUF165 family)
MTDKDELARRGLNVKPLERKDGGSPRDADGVELSGISHPVAPAEPARRGLAVKPLEWGHTGNGAIFYAVNHSNGETIYAIGRADASGASKVFCKTEPKMKGYDVLGFIAFAGFLACLPTANWLIGNVGTVCVPNGPCLIPVGFGLNAPSGVLMIGVALVLRDVVHQRLGASVAFAAIAAGALVSAFISPPALVVASTLAFVLSELADFAIYAPLRRKNLSAAVLASGLVGAAVDSTLFLFVAFGSLDFLSGQLLGKLYATLLVAGALAIMKRIA